MRTKLSNTMNQDTRENLQFQLDNLKCAMGKHPLDSYEFWYLWREGQYLLERLDALEGP